jgi:hypothetical protein
MVGAAKSDCNSPLSTWTGDVSYFISVCSHNSNLLNQRLLASG